MIRTEHDPLTTSPTPPAQTTAPEEWRDRGQWWDFRGHRIFYRDDGHQDEVVLLVHGFPTASWDWHLLWDGLGRQCRLLAPDLLGFGFSAKPPGHHYSIMGQADLVEELAGARGVTSCHVLAHDMGDTVAQELLARHSERREAGRPGLELHSVCLLNGGLFPEAHRLQVVQKLLLSAAGPLISRLLTEVRVKRSLAEVFGPDTPPSAEQLDALWRLISHADGQLIAHRLIHYVRERKTHRSRWVGALRTAAVPLRFIDGLADPVSGPLMVDRYLELIPDPDVIELENVGHFPQLEAPALVLGSYGEFLDRIRRTGVEPLPTASTP